MVKRGNSQNDEPPRESSSTETRGASCRTFKDLLDEGIIGKATWEFTESMGFVKASPVQDAVIPAFLRQDVAVEACTGSGKTLAFVIPTVEMCLKSVSNNETKNDDGSSASVNSCREGVCRVGSVILGPTRELVMQIHEVVKKYLEFVNRKVDLSRTDEDAADSPLLINSLLFTGGNDINGDVVAIRATGKSAEPKIVIATPGRFSHLLEKVKLNTEWTFQSLDVLVLDEADRLLLDCASFERQLSTIFSVLPKQRRTGLFSATLSAEMKGIIKAGMRNPILIRVTLNQKIDTDEQQPRKSLDEEHTDSANNNSNVVNLLPDGLSNYVAVLDRRDKFAFLLKFLFSEIFPPVAPSGSTTKAKGKKCIVFFLTCNCVNVVYKMLSEIQSRRLAPSITENATVERLFGKMQQKSRLASCKRFSDSSSIHGSVLIATDVAARGLDFPDVEWIVQFDAPLVSLPYTKRELICGCYGYC